MCIYKGWERSALPGEAVGEDPRRVGPDRGDERPEHPLDLRKRVQFFFMRLHLCTSVSVHPGWVFWRAQAYAAPTLVCACVRAARTPPRSATKNSVCTVALTLVWYSISVPALARVYALTH